MDFEHSPRCREYLASLQAFVDERILPMEAAWHAGVAEGHDPWQHPAQFETVQSEARARGLWNLFLPDPELGAGLSNTDYAPLAEAMGHSHLAPEVFNCNAPDTGNMEVLVHYGSPQQREEWLTPLLAGEIRSGFCMTEPDVASSDATNMQATARIRGDRVILDGRKWWTTGIGHSRCRLLIFMGLTDPDAPRHQRHSMVLVPLDTPGVEIRRRLEVFGDLDPPYGHGEVVFDQVELPASNVIAGPGRGFEIAQGRLGPGRVHHCMRAIGAAERALSLMVRRGLSREAFGRPLARLGGNGDRIAEARMAIEQARLLVLKTAWLLDTRGIRGARCEVSQIKAVVPAMLQRIVDDAIQMHGGAGVSEDFPLARLFGQARSLRLADGPDEVHRAQVARHELDRHREKPVE